MKKRLYIMLPVIIALIMLFAGCGKQPVALNDIPASPASLASSEAPASPASPASSASSASSALDMISGIETGYAGLIANEPPYIVNSRLSSGSMPELVPSADYGMLMPYAGAVVRTEFGGIQVTRYGFVTMYGMIVTDAVYDSIERAYDSRTNDQKLLPAYQLAYNRPETGYDPVPEKLYAACALDGSWITPFEYVNIVFSESVITLQRSYNSNDIDVYDYFGKFLYNMAERWWIANLDPSQLYELMYNVDSEGYVRAHLRDGTVAFIDMLTGTYRKTEYYSAEGFTDGLAMVLASDPASGQMRWGYINTAFELAIQPKYEYANPFLNGYAVVMAQDGTQYVINRYGEILLSVSDGWIDQYYDGSGITVYDYNTGRNQFYSSDLNMISTYSKYGNLAFVYHIYSSSGGWYIGDCYEIVRYTANGAVICEGYIGKVLFSASEEYLFTGISHISQVEGGYVVFTRGVMRKDETANSGWDISLISQNNMEYHTGVMTLDGVEIIPPEKNASISIVTEGATAKAIIVNTNRYQYYSGSMESAARYKLISTDGYIITSGAGVMSYDEASGLYYVQREDACGYLDPYGNVIFSIPIMSYMMS